MAGNFAGVQTFIVPAGRRAVIRSFGYSITAPSGQWIQLRIVGVLVWTFTSPGTTVNSYNEMRVTVYEGESISVENTHTAIRYHVNGFLFDDTEGPTEADVIRRPIEVEQLPGPPR